MSGRETMVVFDLGGVIVRICRAWDEGCAAAGIDVRADTAEEHMKAKRRAISQAYQRGDMTCQEFFERVAQTTGGHYTAEEVSRVHGAWILGEYDGVASLMDELIAAGVPTGVLSNTNHTHWEQMRTQTHEDGTLRFPTPWRVEHPHASHLLLAAKPEREIYERFEAETGFRGEQIVFFDDLIDNVHAANELGWRAHQIDHTGDTATQMRAHLQSLGLL